MKKLILTLLITSIFIAIPLKNTLSANLYLLPKFSFNFPIKGGDRSIGFGGGLGYWIQPFFAMETTYLRVLGSGNAPNNNILEFDTILAKPLGKISLFLQTGSGFYDITDSNLGTGITGLFDSGIGIGLDFIPSFNLRISSIYYSLFRHKDLITCQMSFALNF